MGELGTRLAEDRSSGIFDGLRSIWVCMICNKTLLRVFLFIFSIESRTKRKKEKKNPKCTMISLKLLVLCSHKKSLALFYHIVSYKIYLDPKIVSNVAK